MTNNQVFYAEITKIRELFHKYGRFDDSNAKLDEIAKYIAIYVYQLKNNISGRHSIKEIIRKYEADESFQLVRCLKELFKSISQSNEFKNRDKSSIFGGQPSLNIDDKDNVFACSLLKLVVNSVDSVLKNDELQFNFDVLNESFGHFVRDNFRNHIEDAQYMTPAEAVELMCNIAIYDLKKEGGKERLNEFVVCDPCCGVGSFLSALYQKNREINFINSEKITFVGQDKVDRMVRLAKINLLMFNNTNNEIFNGNTLVGDSVLNEYQGKTDLILTNPPFGAKFSSDELLENVKINYPLLFDLILNNGSNFNSEILFLDKCLSLLKPNGKILIILPDSVISSGGMNATIRYRLAMDRHLRIRAIIELPTVAFAQAGTRTKTSILYLEKAERPKNDFVFIAQSKEIGFEVSTRKGATIKKEVGVNDLKKIFVAYSNNSVQLNGKDHKVITDNPSCVIIKPELLEKNTWTPSHYNSQRFRAVDSLKHTESDIELVKLSDIVTFATKDRSREYLIGDSKCISVLHVLSDDNLNVEELLIYKPKYPGIPCNSGDLLFSKINPRIPRLLVVPEFDFPLTCSTEFEILNSSIDINNYGIKLLLMLPSVQTQITCLTSGTSSSHNRIKTNDLANILIPLPKRNNKQYRELMVKSKEYERKNREVYELKYAMVVLKKEVFGLVA